MIKKQKANLLEVYSHQFTLWVGTPLSILIHTLIFVVFTATLLLGANFNFVILVWNTSVSLEAIYLALFIQMSVNRQSQHLKNVSANVAELQEDVEDIQEDIADDDEDDKIIANIYKGIEHMKRELDVLKTKRGLVGVDRVKV